MNNDEKHKIWKSGVEYQQQHSEPSPETRERLKALEVNQNNFMSELQEIKKMISELKFDLKDAIEKKADKEEVNQIKSIIKWIGSGIGAGIIGFVTWFFSAGSQHFLK